jgi:hypothetical protein
MATFQFNRNINIDTMSFADDKVLLAKSKDDLQFEQSIIQKLELWLLEGWNQLEVRYALLIRH